MEYQALFHRLITGSEFEISENLRFNEFKTVMIFMWPLILKRLKSLLNNFQGCIQDFLSYMYLLQLYLSKKLFVF